MRVLICGGRDFDDIRAVSKALAELHLQNPFACIVHGGARGADRMAKIWAHRNGIAEFQCDAQWTRLGKKAGPIRNQWMLDHFAPELVVAFPGGGGTKHMISLAIDAGVPVVIPIPFGDGSFTEAQASDNSPAGTPSAAPRAGAVRGSRGLSVRTSHALHNATETD